MSQMAADGGAMVEIEHSRVSLAGSDGAMPAVLCRPKRRGPHPGVLVLMEAFGLTPHIEDVTARIAREGYLAMAPDLYYRDLPHNTFRYDQVNEGVAMMLRLDPSKVIDDVRAALGFLKRSDDVLAGKIGVTGFCMGGGFTFLTACELSSEIAAAAPFYGMVQDEWIEAIHRVTVPVYLFFGGADPFIPPTRVEQIERRFRDLGKNYRIKTYPGADHGFFCHERASYNAPAAEDAWGELMRFFAQHLGP
jgi:carboxymethylenebutenolidase